MKYLGYENSYFSLSLDFEIKTNTPIFSEYIKSSCKY